MNRRTWLRVGLSGATLAALGGLELRSLQGKFDHWREPHLIGNAAYLRSRKRLARIGARARHLLHIGHSTHLLALGAHRILTDPWFYDPAFGSLDHGATPAVRPERVYDPAFGSLDHGATPAVRPERVGELTHVVITHDHADHADPKAIDRLDKRAVGLVATPGLAALLKRSGFQKVHVVKPWETLAFGDLKVTGVPALHDVYEVGFVFQWGRTKVYFAGDTRLHPDLPAIKERFSPQSAILPVDGTRIRGDEPAVMTPQDAVKAAKLLGLSHAIASHCDAAFCDPIAEYLLSTHVPQAGVAFADLMRAQLPRVRGDIPVPGGLIGLAG